MNTSKVNIAIAFYGITRSLKYTAESINTNLIKPTRKFGNCKVFAHFFNQKIINNPRTNEYLENDTNQSNMLHIDHKVISEIKKIEASKILKDLIPYGNAWEDNLESLQNIIRQLISLKIVTGIIENDNHYDYVMFARPDMEYHNEIDWSYITNYSDTSTIFVPDWQWSGGINDRFAICGSKAFPVYGYRLNHTLEYCRAQKLPLHSERLLYYIIKNSTCHIKTVELKATRIRATGTRAEESFKRVKPIKILQAYLYCHLIPRIRNLLNYLLISYRENNFNKNNK